MSGEKPDVSKVLMFPAPAKPAEDPAVVRAHAREALNAAEKTLRDAQREAERASAAMAKAETRLAAVEKEKREIDDRYAKVREEARAASAEAKRTAQAVAAAERALEKARKS